MSFGCVHNSLIDSFQQWVSSNPLEGFLKHRSLGPTLRVADSVGLGWDLNTGHSNRCPGDANSCWWSGTPLWELLPFINSMRFNRYFYIPHWTDGETEAQKGNLLSQNNTGSDNTKIHTWFFLTTSVRLALAANCLCSRREPCHADAAETEQGHFLPARMHSMWRNKSSILCTWTCQVWELKMTLGRYLRWDLVSRWKHNSCTPLPTPSAN